jgi:hypothetical protein
MDGGVKCSLSLSEFVRHWTILVSNFSGAKFHENTVRFSGVACSQTDRQISGKRLKFLVANTLSRKQCDKNSRFCCNRINPFSFLSL